MRRVGVDGLGSHLEAAYGIQVAGIEGLDLGTYRVDRRDGPSWVARLSPAVRPLEWARGDAQILQELSEHDYPSERVATAEPVSVHEGQPVVVTEFVRGVPRTERREAIKQAGGLAALGWLLGRLHTMPLDSATGRPGGAWHHLADGEPRDELAAVAGLLEDAKRPAARSAAGRYDSLVEAVGSLDDGAGLPQALVHPDFVMANVVAPAAGGLVIVDWAGAGRASRAWSLAFLLWSVGFGGDLARVERATAGYRRHVTPEPDELERLEALIRTRPIVFDVWAFCTGRLTLARAAAGVTASRDAAADIATVARKAFGVS
jgi:Ser/Thr protein kinase RdoA (MazF antagonist)